MALPNKQISFIEDCYKLYEQKMFRVALSVLHDETLAEDAVQEAFLQLIKHKVYFASSTSDDCKRFGKLIPAGTGMSCYKEITVEETAKLEASEGDESAS